MDGKKIFEKYISKRDHSGSDSDKYAQLLLTLHQYIKNDLYILLEQADTQGKRIALKEDFSTSILFSEYSVKDIIFV